MTSQDHIHGKEKTGERKPVAQTSIEQPPQVLPAVVIQRAREKPQTLTPPDIQQLQRTVGNQTIGRLLPVAPPPGQKDQVIQRALTYSSFKSAAETVNTRLSVTRSSLTPILNLLQTHQGNWDFQKLALVENEITTLRERTPAKYAKYATALADLGQDIMTERQRLAVTTGINLGDNLSAIRMGATWSVYNRATDKTVVQMLSDAEKNYLVGVMNYMAGKEGSTHIAIRRREGLIQEMVKDRAKMQSGDFTQGPWQEALNTLENTVITRVREDKHLLVADNLITAEHELSSVKFTGSDFHKGGQQVIFLYFTRGDGSDERKVVYKPSSLWLDALLFGKDSVASMLDPEGDVISQYEIIAVADATNEDLKYGYMQFVESELPASAMDLLKVYRSIAGNMAMAYLVGLDDVHKENVVLLKDRIQVIDMEATTGVFDSRTTIGFIGQQWNASITMIKDKLLNQVMANNLRAAPATPIVENAMREEFANTLARAASSDVDAKWDENTDELAHTKSRIVPIATADFYDFITLIRQHHLDSYEAWSEHVTQNAGGILEKARGLTTNSLNSMKRILLSRGTYNALARGDIPYYTRDLGSSSIYDEEGNPIDATGHKKVGRSISTQMDRRRRQDKTKVKALFNNRLFGNSPGKTTTCRG